MRILLVQTAFLGDIILSTPLIGALSEKYPNSELYILTTRAGAELLQYDTRLKGIITFDKRKEEKGLIGLRKKAAEIKRYSFDKVFSLHKSWRTTLLLWLSRIPERVGFKESRLSFLYTTVVKRSEADHEVLRNASLLAACGAGFNDELRLYAPPIETIRPHLGQFVSKGNYTLVFPGSAWNTKRWAKEGYRWVVEKLSKEKLIIVIGSSEERSLCEYVRDQSEAVNLAGDVSLSETIFLVKHASSIISNDSMALHIASAFKIPTVAIFCATSPLFGFGPWKTKSIIVEKEGLSCKPCRRHGGTYCPVGTRRCMDEIDPHRVFHALKEVEWQH